MPIRLFPTLMIGFFAAMTAWTMHQTGRDTAIWAVPLFWGWGWFALRITSPHASPSLVWTLCLAFGARALLLATPLDLSDDLYRYLWEGAAMDAGYNPFRDPPSAIEGLDDPLRDLVNHADIPSIYPPVALLWFRLLHQLGGTVAGAQAATALLDLVTVTALWTLCHTARRPTAPALYYAVLPLPIVESASSAHLEVVAIALTMLAFRQAPRLQAFLVVLGAGTKLMPVIVLPALLRAHPRAALHGAIVGTLGIAAATLPVLDAGPALFTGFDTYTRHWEFNGFAYPWLHPLLGEHTRPLLIFLGIAIGIGTLWRGLPPLETWRVVGSAFVLLSPTCHPWYVLWALVPDLASGRRFWAVASTALMGSYLVLGTLVSAQGWHEPAWLWWVTWPPALSLGAWVDRSRSAAPTLQPGGPPHRAIPDGEQSQEGQ